MKLIKMSYKGFTFEVNPQTISIDYSKSVSTRSFPFFTSKAQEISINPTKISASGKFVGESAREFANKFERVFKSKGSAYLFVVDSTPIKAFFTALNISFDSKENAVSYTFEFVEDYQGKQRYFDFGYTYAKDGENLYDIANRTGVSVETLYDLNNFCDLFAVEGGDKVWLC